MTSICFVAALLRPQNDEVKKAVMADEQDAAYSASFAITFATAHCHVATSPPFNPISQKAFFIPPRQ